MIHESKYDIDDSRHPVWAAVADVASMDAVKKAVASEDHVWDVITLIQDSVLAALDTVGYPEASQE